ncbi:MAG: SDR family NAD(P)-dependent oxidoreductase [Myxococcota bacterium]|nr:SDR family NAD(P)-dependent oxidoreductase [Myxococcota bacterium]
MTGASTGLGLAIARRLLETRHRLILTARPASLRRFEAAGVTESERVHVRALDVTDPGMRHRVIAEAYHRWGGVDVLINNAGVAYRAVVEHVVEDERREQMSVNFNAPMELARLVLPGMRERRRGHILTVSSVGGMMAMPTMAVYSASKFALEGACEALWYEIRPWNVRVSLIEPGFIRSSSFERVRYTPMSRRSEDESEEPYHAHYEHMGPFIARMMQGWLATPEEKVARAVVRTMHRADPPLRVLATLDARLFDAMRRLLPRRLYHWLLYRSLPSISDWGSRPPPDFSARPLPEPPKSLTKPSPGQVS